MQPRRAIPPAPLKSARTIAIPRSQPQPALPSSHDSPNAHRRHPVTALPARPPPDSPARQVAERAGHTQHQMADELQAAAKVTADMAASFDDAMWAGPAPVELPETLGTAVEGIWYDAFVHSDDIRAALGRPSASGPGLRAAVSHLTDLLTQRSWGPATLALDGLEPFAVSGGGGQRVTGDPLSFVLAATGRADAATVGLDAGVNVYG